MTHESGRPTPTNRSAKSGQERHQGAGDGQHLSTRGLVIVFASLATALLLGYLLLNKLIDMSQQEDCALAHRYNCEAVEISR